MRHNRLANLVTQDLLPQPSVPALNPGNCLGCPLALVQGFTPDQRLAMDRLPPGIPASADRCSSVVAGARPPGELELKTATRLRPRLERRHEAGECAMH